MSSESQSQQGEVAVALSFLLARIGSWTSAGWNQHLRHEFGDERANVMIDGIRRVRAPGPLTAETSGFFEGAPIDLCTFQRLNAERIPLFKHTLDEWSEMEWGCAAAGEVGELCNMLKKRKRLPDHNRPGYDLRGKKTPTADEAGEEIADSIIYLAACASRLGVDLNNAIRAKWNKVSEEVGFAGRL